MVAIVNQESGQLKTIQTQKKSTKESGLFNLISMLMSENHELAQKQHIEKLEQAKREAFLIHIVDLPEISLFQALGYHCYERHLTIDKYFAEESSPKGIAGFAYAHYTEKHRHPISKGEIIVHAYYNPQGQYINAQIKEGDLQQNVSVEQERHIKRNAADAQQILDNLISEKAQRFHHAMDEVESLEQKLTALDAHLDSRQKINSYIDCATKFLNKITEKNAYDDFSIDQRGQLIKRKIQTLKTPKAMPKKSIQDQETSIYNCDKSFEEVPSSMDATTSDVVRAALQQKLADDFCGIQFLAKDLKILLDVKELDEKVKTYQAAYHLEQLIFEWMLSHNFAYPKGKQKFIDDINADIHSIDLKKLFRLCIEHGNVGAFKKLFELGKDTLKRENFFDWLMDVLNRYDKETLGNQLEIFKFLFEESSSYRHFIITANYECVKHNNGSLPSSILFLVANLYGNHLLYALLLEQGYNPNGFAFVYEEKSVTLLRGLTQNVDPKYTELLLQKGATLNRPLMKAMTHIDPRHKKLVPSEILEMVQSKKNMAIIKNHVLPYQPATIEHKSVLQKFFETRSDLSLACAANNLEVVKLLVKKSSIEDLACAISIAASNNRIGILFLPCVFNSSPAFVEDLSQKGEIFVRECALAQKFHVQRAKFIFSRHPETEPYNHFFEMAKILYAELQSRCGGEYQIIDATISRLEKTIEHRVRDKDIENLYELYFAIKILIVEKGELNISSVLKLMHISCHLGKSLQKMQQSGSHLAQFNDVINLANAYPEYSTKLVENSLFKYAVKQLQNTPHEYKTQEESDISQHTATQTTPGIMILSAQGKSINASRSALEISEIKLEKRK